MCFNFFVENKKCKYVFTVNIFTNFARQNKTHTKWKFLKE